jgi:arylsulfatase A-like enzyme
MSTNNLAYSWKAHLLSNPETKRLHGLLKENTFDEASFLYDLYKTSTVNEVSQFKYQLSQTQSQLIDVSLKQIIEQTNKEDNAETSSFETVASGIVEAKKIMSEQIDSEMIAVNESRDKI